jgi:hypothetical protein
MGWFTDKPRRYPAALSLEECEPLLPMIPPAIARNGARLIVPIGHFFLDSNTRRLVILRTLNCEQTRMNRTREGHVLVTVARHLSLFSEGDHVVVSEADFEVLRKRVGPKWSDNQHVRVVDPSVGEDNYWPVVVEEGGKRTIEEV